MEKPVHLEDYQERYVAFLDLLGFTAQVQRAERDFEVRAKLREILCLMRDTLCESPAIGMRFTYFSDCIVLSALRSRSGLWEMFQSIDLLTFNLLQYDVFVRGGLTAGLAHHSKDFVYGTGLIQAYALEREQAIAPLTLVAPEVVVDTRSYGPDFLCWLSEDSTDRYFVNYLRRFAEYRREPRLPGMVVMEDPAQRVMQFVQHRLNSHTGSILEKAQWFQAYWNRTVATEGVFGAIEVGITGQYRSSGPTIIVRRMVAPSC